MADEKKISAAPAKAVTAVKKDDNTKPGFFKRVGKCSSPTTLSSPS